MTAKTLYSRKKIENGVCGNHRKNGEYCIGDGPKNSTLSGMCENETNLVQSTKTYHISALSDLEKSHLFWLCFKSYLCLFCTSIRPSVHPPNPTIWIFLQLDIQRIEKIHKTTESDQIGISFPLRFCVYVWVNVSLCG